MGYVLCILLMTTSAIAGEVTEETKANALRRAFQVYGNSSWGSIDIDNEPTPIRVIPIVPQVKEVKVAESVKVEKVVESNTCTRHHMRKVVTHSGRSWKCRK